MYEKLWGKVDLLLNKSVEERKRLQNFASNLSQNSKLDEQQAQSLALHRKKAPLDYDISQGEHTSTFHESLNAFGIVFLDNVIKSKIVVAHEYATLGSKLENFGREQKLIQRKIQAESARLDKSLEAQMYIFTRSRKKYFEACEKQEELRRKSFCEKPQDFAKVHARMQAAVYSAVEAEKLHRQVVMETRKAQKRFKSEKEKLAQQLQALEQARARKLQLSMSRLVKVHREQTEYVQNLIRELDTISLRIDGEKDICAFHDVQADTCEPIDLVEFDSFKSAEKTGLEKVSSPMQRLLPSSAWIGTASRKSPEHANVKAA